MAKKNNSDIMINVLLDRSGSMGGLENDVIGHYNKYIEEQAALPGKATVSLVLFDSVYEEVYINRDIKEVPVLDNKTYFVRGSTAYLDALGRLIKSVDAIPNKPSKVVFVINTDGYENASREYKAETIKEIITERTNNHDWQFVFIGAGIDALKESQSLGATTFYAAAVGPRGQAMSYTNLNVSTSNYRSGITQTLDMQNPDVIDSLDSLVDNTSSTPAKQLKKKKATTSK